MPELPEVENFRSLLLPFVGNTLVIEPVGDNRRIQLRCPGVPVVCTDVLRRGKQICLVLKDSKALKYLYLHMGMTGRIRVPGKDENWGDLKGDKVVGHADAERNDGTSPPKYTYLVFATTKTNYTAYFCDPRKFGSCYEANDLSDLDALAPDALTCIDPDVIDKNILPALTNQRLGVKAILLDQKRAVSGVGNWVADEVLYQCGMHPDQTRLDCSEAKALWSKLQEIVYIAVNALRSDKSYPENWLFHFRWTRKKAARDAVGRSISFVTSGGRTSAVVSSHQKLYVRRVAKPKCLHEEAIGESSYEFSASDDPKLRKNKIPPSRKQHVAKSRSGKNATVSAKTLSKESIAVSRRSTRLAGRNVELLG
jgi:formamidopyrimidine-DNA glycosylase